MSRNIANFPAAVVVFLHYSGPFFFFFRIGDLVIVEMGVVLSSRQYKRHSISTQHGHREICCEDKFRVCFPLKATVAVQKALDCSVFINRAKVKLFITLKFHFDLLFCCSFLLLEFSCLAQTCMSKN